VNGVYYRGVIISLDEIQDLIVSPDRAGPGKVQPVFFGGNRGITSYFVGDFDALAKFSSSGIRL
jgi:hypothetical protein